MTVHFLFFQLQPASMSIVLQLKQRMMELVSHVRCLGNTKQIAHISLVVIICKTTPQGGFVTSLLYYLGNNLCRGMTLSTLHHLMSLIIILVHL